MIYNIALINGDGIGPEVVNEAKKVLKKIEEVSDIKFSIREVLATGEAIDKVGEPLPKESLEICKNSDAVIIGNIGGRKWRDYALDKKPERTIFILRKEFNASINIRPIITNINLIERSPLKKEIIEKGMDILVFRDIVGGVYCSEKVNNIGEFGREAWDTEYYNEKIIKALVVKGFESAMKRRKKLASLDKANAMASSVLWRKIVNEIAEDYPEVEVEHYYIDNASMEVLKDPSKFDVIVASNMFGDIIADELSQITGCPGILGSAEISSTGKGIYTPNQLHNEDESLIGKDKVNPIGLILSSALMLRHSLGLEEEAKKIENAVEEVLSQGYATYDIYSEGKRLVRCSQMGELIRNNIS